MIVENPAASTFEGYCILELMGRRKLAGLVKEVVIAGAGFLRVDVPGEDGRTTLTQFYPPSSVYAISPVSEEVARAFALRYPVEPVTRFELAAALPAVRPTPVFGQPLPMVGDVDDAYMHSFYDDESDMDEDEDAADEV